MKRTLLYKSALIAACLAMTFAAACVKDGSSPCNNRLRIVYDYNMKQKDLFDVQGRFLSIYAFDSATGLFELEIPLRGPFPEKLTIDVPPSLYGKEYDYVVWAGLHADSYDFLTPRKGVTRIEELKVQIQGYSDQCVEKELEPLWHGMLKGIKFDNDTEQTKVISLIKNTNKFRLVFTFRENGEKVNPYHASDLNVDIFTTCGWYAHHNEVLDDRDREIRHTPYIAEEGGDITLNYELNTTRLMSDRETTLLVTSKLDGALVMQLPLNDYLNQLRLFEESWINNLQEYFDREDQFRILIYLDESEVNKEWISTRVVINDWIVREHNISNR